jgi:hypothetical protein
MATKAEYDERYGWWRNELASLGLVIRKEMSLIISKRFVA